PSSPLFPYTTLFRSPLGALGHPQGDVRAGRRGRGGHRDTTAVRRVRRRRGERGHGQGSRTESESHGTHREPPDTRSLPREGGARILAGAPVTPSGWRPRRARFEAAG